MKKLVICLTLCFTLFSCAVKKQIYFHGGTQPNTIYTYEVKEEIVNSADFVGSELYLENIKKKYGKIPIVISGDTHYQYSSETGPKNVDSTFSMITSYGLLTFYTELNGKGTTVEDPLSEAVIKGYVNKNNKFVLDTVISKGDIERIKTILNSMEKRREIDTFPSIHLKVGDKFEKKTPKSHLFNNLILNSTFKLKKVKNGMAFFDVFQTASAVDTLSRGDIKVVGKGKGKYIFDLNYKCFINKEYEYNFLVTQQSKDLKMLHKVYEKSKITTIVTNR